MQQYVPKPYMLTLALKWNHPNKYVPVMSMPTTINIATLIVRSSDTCGDRPRIAGTRISVQQIAVLHQQGLSVADMIAEYDFLTPAQVYAALTYYYANQTEIETYLAEEEQEYDRLVAEQAAS
jgi:uncharacterized protein (DUF433 family)